MKIFGVLFFIAAAGITGFAQRYPCLPVDVKESTVVDTFNVTSSKGVETIAPVTVKQTLKKLKARCSRGKLLDHKGKQITFVMRQGCWGNPPEDYREILEKQRKDIALLRKKFTVIEITCNVGGTQPI